MLIWLSTIITQSLLCYYVMLFSGLFFKPNSCLLRFYYMLFIPGRKFDVVIVVVVCIFGMIGKCVLCYYVITPLLCRYYVIMPLLCYYIMQLLCYCVFIMFSTNVFYKHTVVWTPSDINKWSSSMARCTRYNIMW
jgi:hypothetical protein